MLTSLQLHVKYPLYDEWIYCGDIFFLVLYIFVGVISYNTLLILEKMHFFPASFWLVKLHPATSDFKHLVIQGLELNAISLDFEFHWFEV